MKKILTAFAVLTLLLCAATAQANLITNGTFDEGLDGWSTTSGTTWDSKAQAAKFGSSGASIFTQNLFQSFSIDPNTTSLSLSFDISISKSMLTTGLSTFSVFFNAFELNLDNFLLYSWVSSEKGLTTTITHEIELGSLLSIPLDSSILFTYTGASVLGTIGIQLDNIMLTANAAPAVPVPAAVWLLGSGLAGMAALRRKMN